MTDPLESSGVRRTCPRCGNLTDATARFCKKCGLGFTQASPAAPQSSASVSGVAPEPVPAYSAPAQRASSGTKLAIIAALVAGLAIGAYLFYRIVAAKPNAPVAKRSDAATIPAVNSESTPSSVKPPPEADALTAKMPETVPERASPPKHQKTPAQVPIASVDTPPVLITNAPNTSVATATSVPAAPAPSVATPQASAAPRRRAVQETEAETTPIPSSPIANEPAPPATNAAPANNAAAPAPIRKPSYDGPMAGMATWTGKLEKNGTLTITGGTSSIGVLSGAGLPGVPVRVTIDQTNLGFVEMPDAANGYRRLVLKSHAHHDKITIHWSVVQ